jgi:hypothetical protein
MRRRLLAFVIVDAVAIAALGGWWWSGQRARQRPVTPPPSATPTAAAGMPASAPVADAAKPVAPAGQVELHGRLRGQPFWLRLSPPQPELGGKRRLDLLFTPPAPAEISGSLMHDSPVLVVDEHLGLIRWDNRDGATGLTRTAAPDGYKLMREVHGAEDRIELLQRSLPGEPAWDLHLAPLLVAIVWRGDAPPSAMRTVDFWGPRAAEPLRTTIAGTAVVIGGSATTASADPAGRLRALVGADGAALLTVDGWIDPPARP